MAAETKRETLPVSDPDPWREVNGRLIPVKGVGASHGYGSDCYPFTVVAVSPSGHQITLRADSARVVEGSFMEGNAVCEFYAQEESFDWEGKTNDQTATRRSREHRCGNCGSISSTKVTSCERTLGCREVKQTWYPVYKMKGSTGRRVPSVSIGHRRYYQDPHF